MKQKTNINDDARKKYLFLQPLNSDEEAVIRKDLDSPEYADFSHNAGLPLLLPDKYSAESTFSLIEKRIHKNRHTIWRYWPAAASIALLLGIAGFVLLRQPSGQPLTASTGYGEIMEIVLPDSSVVVLNALSSLTYPDRFSKKERSVNLTGEGYFKVRKDQSKPFKVQTGEMEVEVLGTVFNVQSYENEDVIETSLLEGSVAVHYGKNNRQILKPGEIAYYDKASASLKTVSSDLTAVGLWQQGILNFDNMPLEEILKTLERQYKIPFELGNKKLQQLRITARFTTGEPLEHIVEILSNSAGFTYKKSGTKIIIK